MVVVYSAWSSHDGGGQRGQRKGGSGFELMVVDGLPVARHCALLGLQLTEVPAEIGALTELTRLSLSR